MTVIITTVVDPVISFRFGHVTFFISSLTSRKNLNIFLNMYINAPIINKNYRSTIMDKLYHHKKAIIKDNNGRPGETRTHSAWFWRPVLCHQSYGPALLIPDRHYIAYLVSLCVVCFLQNLQYFFNSNLSGVRRLFLVVV